MADVGEGDDLLRTFAEISDFAEARAVAARHYDITEREAVQTGLSAEIAKVLRRYVRDGLAERYYGPRSCVYKPTPKARAFALAADRGGEAA